MIGYTNPKDGSGATGLELQYDEVLSQYNKKVAAVADVAISANSNGYYAPGALTASTALFASAIAEDSVDRLGMEYNHEQDLFADAVAVDILKHLGYDENALATALNRIKIIDIFFIFFIIYLQKFTLKKSINKKNKNIQYE